MTQSPSPKAPPRPFLAAAPETRALIARLLDLAARPEAFPFETQAPADWARIGFAAQDEAERRALIEASAKLLERRPDLEAFSRHGVSFRRRAASSPRVAALFSGGEGVHLRMGASLSASFPRAAVPLASFDRMFEALGDPLLSEVVRGSDAQAAGRLRAPLYAQLGAAALAAGQYGVLRAGGFAPDMFGGYDSGEIAALWAAGAMEAETLGALLYARAEAMSAPDPWRPSANLRVFAPIQNSLDLIGESGLRVFVARHEAPRSHVVGGDVEELEAFAARLLGRGIAHEPVSGALAAQSSRAEVAAATFAGALRRARLTDPARPVYSGERAAPYEAGEIAEGLARQLTRPLRFQEMIERMHADGARIFVEFGPGDVLTNHVREILDGRPHLALALDSGEPETAARRAMEAAAALAAAGAPFKGERPPAPPYGRPEPQPLQEPAPQEAAPEAPEALAETRSVEAEPEAFAEISAETPAQAAPEAAGAHEAYEEPQVEEQAPANPHLLRAAMAEDEADAEEKPAPILAQAEAEPPPAEEETRPEPEPPVAEREPQAEASAEPPPAEPVVEPSAEPAAEHVAERVVEVEAEAETPAPAEPAEAELRTEPPPAVESAARPAEEPEPEAQPEPEPPLTGAALALLLAERIASTHERFLENQTLALRALLEASADPEALLAVEEARREAAEAHRVYLEGIVALSGTRPRLTAAPSSPPPALAALAAQEADWPTAPEPLDEEPYVDPPERFAPVATPLAAVPEAQPESEALDLRAEEAVEPEETGPLAEEAPKRPLESPAEEPVLMEAQAEPEERPTLEETVLEEAAPDEEVPEEEVLEEAAEAEPVLLAASFEAPAEEVEAQPEPPAPEPEPEAEAQAEAAALPEASASSAPEETPNLPALIPPQELTVLPGAESHGEGPLFAESALTRLAFHLAPVSAPPLRRDGPEDARWLIVGDGDLASALARSLKREAADQPCAAVVAAADVGALQLFRDSGPWTGVVYLHPPGEDERTALGRLEIARSLAEAVQEAFHEAAARGERRVFAAVARLDGVLGYGPHAVETLGAASFGLVKALAAAEPNLFCRAVDLAADLPGERAADLLAAELGDADRGRVEIALNEAGRFESLPFSEPLPEAEEPAEAEAEAKPNELFVLLGDARGLATLWLEEAAARAPRRFLLLGSHRLLPDEPVWSIGITSEESLRWAAFQALEAEGADEERAAVGAVALSEAVLADRETRSCLAELRRLGSEAAYATVDFDGADAADQIAEHLEDSGGCAVSLFYAPPSEPEAGFSIAFRRRMRRVETLLDAFSGADLRRIWFLPVALDASESLSEAMADEAVRRFAMGARAMGIDVRALVWAHAEEVETGVVAALAEELRRPASGLGLSLIGGVETAVSRRRIDPSALAAGGAALRVDWSALFGSEAMAAPAEGEPPALSPAFALAAAFAATERFAPGWRVQGCAGVSLAEGAALDEDWTAWTSLGLRSAERIDEAAIRADLELLDGSGRTRLKIEGARFSARPAPQAEPLAALEPPEDSAEVFYADGTLLREEGLRALAAYRMEEGAEDGIFALSPDPAEIDGAERSALFDPLLVEAMAQGALAAARRRSGKIGALMRLEALEIHEAAPAHGPVLIEARLRRDAERAAVWLMTARTPEGAALLSFEAAVLLDPAALGRLRQGEPAQPARSA